MRVVPLWLWIALPVSALIAFAAIQDVRSQSALSRTTQVRTTPGTDPSNEVAILRRQLTQPTGIDFSVGGINFRAALLTMVDAILRLEERAERFERECRR